MRENQQDPARRAHAAQLRAQVSAERERNKRWVSDSTMMVGLGAFALTLAFAGGAAIADGAGSSSDQAGTSGQDRSGTAAADQGFTDQGSGFNDFGDDGDTWSGNATAPSSGGFFGGGSSHASSGGS